MLPRGLTSAVKPVLVDIQILILPFHLSERQLTLQHFFHKIDVTCGRSTLMRSLGFYFLIQNQQNDEGRIHKLAKLTKLLSWRDSHAHLNQLCNGHTETPALHIAT